MTNATERKQYAIEVFTGGDPGEWVRTSVGCGTPTEAEAHRVLVNRMCFWGTRVVWERW